MGYFMDARNAKPNPMLRPILTISTVFMVIIHGLLYGRKKRDAEADADPYYFYGLYGGHYPHVTSVGGLTTYSNGAVVPTDPANQAATAAHLAYKGAHYGYGYPYAYWG